MAEEKRITQDFMSYSVTLKNSICSIFERPESEVVHLTVIHFTLVKPRFFFFEVLNASFKCS